MGVTERLKEPSGQMTVEFMVMFPVLIVVVVIAVNALLFFSECAAFDLQARNAIRTYATSPAYGQTTAQCVDAIKQELLTGYNDDYQDVSVQAEAREAGMIEYRATLSLRPTLFGMGLKSQVFGVGMPALQHSAYLVVSPYKPGVVW